MRPPERGVALLEVLVAVVILATAAMALLEVVDSGTRAVVEARARERELADENRLLSAFTLLARSDLDRRLGTRDVGPYRVTVQRPEPTLYRVALSREQAPEIEDLVTVIFRQEPTRAP